MTTILIIFAVAFVVSTALTRISISIAHRWSLYDRPDQLHKEGSVGIPNIGGFAIFFGFIGAIVLLLIFRNQSTMANHILADAQKLSGIMVCTLLALLLGRADDHFNMRPALKLLLQGVIASAAYSFGYEITAISNPFGTAFSLGSFSLPVTILWYLCCMNAVNLMDGLDGLATGVVLLVCFTLFLVSLQYRNLLGLVLMSGMSGALLGFLVFNFPPAKIYLGNAGSMLLGFMVASVSLLGASRKAEAAVALFVPLIALGLPLLDSCMAVIRRWYKRMPISTADRSHIHHMLVSMGYSKKRAVLILYGFSIVYGSAALLITFVRNEAVFFIIAVLTVMAFVSIRIFSGVKWTSVLRKLAEDNEKRRYEGLIRVRVNELIDSLEASGSDMEAFWQQLKDLLQTLDFDSIRLSSRNEQREHHVFREGSIEQKDRTDHTILVLHVPILHTEQRRIVLHAQKVLHAESPHFFSDLIIDLHQELRRLEPVLLSS